MKRIVLLFLAMLPIAAHATVITQNLNVAFVCSGSTGPYPFTFSISDPTALTVTQNGTVLASTDYTMIAVNNNYENGGNVTLNSACPAAQTLVLTRSTPLTQATVFSDNMPVPMKSFERGLDKLTEIVQEQAGGGGSGLPAGCTSSSTGNISCTGTVNATSLTAQSVNGAINPLTYAGSDIAAKTSNAVSALGCSSTFPCNFVLPPSPQMSFSGTLTLTDSMTFSCTPAGESARQSAAQPPTLNYTGSGTAVVINGARAQFNGCGLAMGNATTGILIENQNAQINNVYTIGGNVGSVLVELGVSDNAQINQFTAFEFQGDGIWSHDNYDSTITNSLMYGYTIGGASGATNHTSRSLVMDSGTAGIHIKNFGGGDSGLHGIVVQDLHNPGHPPVQIFASDVISDCSYGDGLLFDSSLGVSAIVAEFDETWISAAGDSCNGTSIRGLTTANNVHISGGKGIHFIGGWFRSAANNPFLIDNSNAGDISITNAFLYGGNCFNNNTPSTVAGVNVTANIDGLLVDGNTDGFAEYCGNQGWGVLIGSGLTSMNNVRITNNDFYGNTVGSISAPAGFPLIQSGNVNSFLPELTAGTKTLLGGGPLGVWNNVNRNNAWLLPFDTTSGIGGLSVNGYFDGTNFIFPSDGISNGGTLIGMNYDASPSFTFYCVPDSGSPTVTQTIAPGSMSADNCGSLSRAGFSAATVTDKSSLVFDPGLSAGSDMCAQICNAAASCVSAGLTSCTIDARRIGYSGTQNCAHGPFYGCGLPSGSGNFTGVLDLQGVQMTIANPDVAAPCGATGSGECLMLVPDGWTVDGHASHSGAAPYYPFIGSSIAPYSALPTGSAVVSMGQNTATAPRGSIIQNIAISCVPPGGTYVVGSNLTGYLNAAAQEASKFHDLTVSNCAFGFDIEYGNTGGASSSHDSSGGDESSVELPCDAANIGLQIGGSAFGVAGLNHIADVHDISINGLPSCYSSGAQTALGTGVDIEATDVTVRAIRTAYVGTALNIGLTRTAQNVTVENLNNAYSSTTNSLGTLVHIGGATGQNGVTLVNVADAGIYTSGATVLQDDSYAGSSCTLLATSNENIAFYSKGWGGGANQVILSTLRAACGPMGIYSGLLAGNYTYAGSNYYTGTQVYQGAGGWNIYTATAATSGGNVNSSPFSIQGNCWNGSASAACGLKFVATPAATGTNPLVTMNVTSTNTGDAMYWYWGTTANPVQIAYFKPPWFYNVAGTYYWKYSFTGTAARNVFIPDGDSATAMATSFTTTSGTSDNVTITGMTSSGHCELEPTNASAATNLATTYVSAKASNQITVTHAATANMNYDVLCTSN